MKGEKNATLTSPSINAVQAHVQLKYTCVENSDNKSNVVSIKYVLCVKL